jgi:hypothetical protein
MYGLKPVPFFGYSPNLSGLWMYGLKPVPFFGYSPNLSVLRIYGPYASFAEAVRFFG